MDNIDCLEAQELETYDRNGPNSLFDTEGFLNNPESWNENIAREIAQAQGLPELTDFHWRIIRFLRDYYLTMGKAPLNSELKKGVGLSLMQIEKMFPNGIRLGARRIAGLPNPKNC
ncbi:MAG: TusE/DsrC/DsvC family sulfur relay protein [Desulfomonilaceae bacterium]